MLWRRASLIACVLGNVSGEMTRWFWRSNRVGFIVSELGEEKPGLPGGQSVSGGGRGWPRPRDSELHAGGAEVIPSNSQCFFPGRSCELSLT
jgi:hypothetical protein